MSGTSRKNDASDKHDALAERQARARAYLDLWEQNLTLQATRGRAVATDPERA